MKVQYEDSCLSQGRVYEWVERFQNGRQNISDEHRSGRPVSVASETVKQQVELFSRGHPQACGQVDQVCCEAGGLCQKIRHNFCKYSCKKVIIKFLLFNDLLSYILLYLSDIILQTSLSYSISHTDAYLQECLFSMWRCMLLLCFVWHGQYGH